MRINNQIRISPIRLIDEKGRNMGIVPTEEALRLAEERNLDLVEIAPQARPPVCRIIDFGKYQYQQTKKQREQRAKQKKMGLKGIRISLRTGQHDLEMKARQADKFLEKGHKVRLEIILRGREKTHQDLAKEKLESFRKLITRETIIEQEIKKYPRGLSMTIAKQ